MRFLFTVASYFPSKGGVQMVTQYTAEQLVDFGHEVTIIVSNHDNKTQQLNNLNGVNLIYTDVFTKCDVVKGNKSKYIELVKNTCEDMDVLVNVSLQTATTDILLRHLHEIKCKKVLYLHDIHDFKLQKNDFESLKRIISKLYYNFRRKIFYSHAYKYIRNYDLITHLSQFDLSMEYMKKHNIHQNIVIGNAATDSVFSRKIVNDKKEKYYLCVANYAERKYQEFILRAFYNTKNNEYKMIFIGREENDYLRYLKKISLELESKHGQKQIEFLVNIPRDRTEEIIAGSSCMLLSSAFERFPVVLVESMACKNPWISTQQGCIKYLPGGFVVSNEDEMTYWMDFIANNFDVACKIGEAGYIYAKNTMTVEARVKQLINAINDI